MYYSILIILLSFLPENLQPWYSSCSLGDWGAAAEKAGDIYAADSTDVDALAAMFIASALENEFEVGTGFSAESFLPDSMTSLTLTAHGALLMSGTDPLPEEAGEQLLESIRQDHDSPWKEALENRFPEFLALLFPAIHAEVDWNRDLEFLDKELQQVVQDAELGRRHADKLVKVWARDGGEAWLLIHVEVQGEAERTFAERMYVYHYRLFDRYQVDVVSLGVLADTTKAFRPNAFRWARWGCEIAFRFPTVKLLDWQARRSELEASNNRFALVVMAQLEAKASVEAEERKAAKFRLVRLMYDRGYSRSDILELFRIIDWMIRLPEDLEREFLAAVYEIEEAKKMPYVTSAERFGIEKGKREGKLEGEAAMLLRLMGRKYGPNALGAYRERVERADTETLLEWAERVLTAETVDEVFH